MFSVDAGMVKIDALSTVQIVIMIVAAILLIVATFLARSTRRFLRSAVSARGTILENTLSTDSDGDPIYKPRFTFTLPDGREICVQSNLGTSPPSFRKGQSVTVLYDPSIPEQAKINTFMQLWGGALICGGVAVVFLVVGCFLSNAS
jgi:hypothetical protein